MAVHYIQQFRTQLNALIAAKFGDAVTNGTPITQTMLDEIEEEIYSYSITTKVVKKYSDNELSQHVHEDHAGYALMISKPLGDEFPGQFEVVTLDLRVGDTRVQLEQKEKELRQQLIDQRVQDAADGLESSEFISGLSDHLQNNV